MKKTLSLILFLFSVINLMAQPGPGKNKNTEGKQKIKALYTAYITQELNLTQDESAKFWAIHNEFNAEMREVNRTQQTELEKEEAALAVKKKYNKKFSGVIGNERTNLFFKKDGEFRHKLVEKVKEKKAQRRGDKKGSQQNKR